MSSASPLASVASFDARLVARSNLPAPAQGFQRADELGRDPDASGLVLLRGPRGALEATARHLERCGRATERTVVVVAGVDDPFRELAGRFAAASCCDPPAAAEAIAARADGALVLLHDPTPASWGQAVADELARLAAQEGALRCLIFVLRPLAEDDFTGPVGVLPAAGSPRGAPLLEIPAVASPEDVRLFWGGIAADAERQSAGRFDRFEALDGWWAAARATSEAARPSATELGPDAARLLERLALARRGWPASQAMRLGSAAAHRELTFKGVVACDPHGRLVVVAPPAHVSAPSPAPAPSAATALAVAEALEAMAPGDPWAWARASELHVLGGAFERAEKGIARALGLVADAAARADFWDRWEVSLETMGAAASSGPRLRAADLALQLGCVDRALGFARAAVARDGETHATMLTLGRATAARGDLTTAGLLLAKALERAPDVAATARAAVEMAEVRYATGDFDAARAHAVAGCAAAGEPATRLLGSNVLGKLLLANASWDEAQRHFAGDACEAATAGDVAGELRALLNRAIALLSSGRRDEAAAMLTSVLEEGERHGDARAMSFALANLATIAILRHDYPDAVRFCERAIELCRRVGERIVLARIIKNLAVLRTRLGLLAEAEQALAFGRKACGPGMPAGTAGHFALVAARIHLARGNTLEAASELSAALSSAAASSDGARLGEVHRLLARVALEDGDLARAEHALVRARPHAGAADARAELAVLEATRARAAGEAFGDLALEALDLAREADDSQLAGEALVLLHHAALDAGDLRSARAQVGAALVLRDGLAESLPPGQRERFLARRDLAPLARLEAWLATSLALEAEGRRQGPLPGREGANDALEEDAPRTIRSSARPSSPGSRAGGAAGEGARRIVGRDPAVLALLSAVQKVGASDATVLIHGESGTGKELVAEALHQASARSRGPLVKVNCAALVETLLLSELFGHEKGAFTGAATRRRGRFEMAENGTLFLDEIGDISPRTQVALLRVLQDRTYERVGGVAPLHANVRILCATHRDLRAMVARGDFREDLYYRLRGVVLEVPALRQRLGDLPAIASSILVRVASERAEPGTPKRLGARALEGLSRHPWPGNVRELENALRAAALFAEGDVIELEDLTSNVEGLRGCEAAPAPGPGAASAARLAGRSSQVDDGGELTDEALAPLGFDGDSATEQLGPKRAVEAGVMARPSRNELAPALAQPHPWSGSATEVAYAHVRSGVSLGDLKRQIERECIARALGESGGNITRAATLLGMKRPRLSQLVKQYGLGGDGGDDGGSSPTPGTDPGADVDSEES